MKCSVSVVGVLLLGLLLVSAEPLRLDNYRIYNVLLETEEQLGAFQANPQLYYMYDPFQVGQHLKIVLSPEEQPLFDRLSRELSLNRTLLVDNLQRLVDREGVKSRATGFALDQFNRIDDINEWLDSLAVDYPNIVTRIQGGRTYEGRTIEGIKISKNANNPGILIESNIHAAEWICSSSVLWIIHEMLTSTDPEIVALTEDYNWIIFPVLNPDGYEYSHEHNRLWRKTRSRNGLICWGTDPNRNFPYKWGVEKLYPATSDDPCVAVYEGAGPLSEIEVRTFTEYVSSIRNEFQMYLSMHSAIRYVMSPWGFTGERPEHYEDHMAMMAAATERMIATHGMEYLFGPTTEMLYQVIGTSMDWAYGELGVVPTFVYEFRDMGEDGEYYGFVPPPSEIELNGREVLHSFIGLTAKAKELGYLN